MTVVIIIDNERYEPLENNDSGDYYRKSRVWTARQPWQ